MDASPTDGSHRTAVTGLSPGAMEEERHRLRVKLSSFEGPLDLLLHLVRINEIDIYDIPVLEIARQYDEYLELMRDLDLDVAGEFLVMASTLAYIKSRMLLPRPALEEEEDDPRRELAEQLLEHQRFVMAAEDLSARSDIQEALWTRPPERREDLDGEFLLEVSLFDLVHSFRTLMESLAGSASFAVNPDGISVPERMAQILEMLEGRELVDFDALFPGTAVKREQIVTFLALLELLRLQLVQAWQRGLFGAIRLSRVSGVPSSPFLYEEQP